MKRSFLSLSVFLLIQTISIAQNKVTSYNDLSKQLSDFVVHTDTIQKGALVTGKGFNLFIQKKVSTYLTGSSEISLSKMYGTYSSESDKLTFGLNKPWINPETQRLSSLLTPMIETNIKNSFATLYKKGEWQSDIRAGLKYSYLLPFSTINFYGMEQPGDQKSKMIRKRNLALQGVLDKVVKENKTYVAPADTTLAKSQKFLLEKHQQEYNALQKAMTAKTIDDSAAKKRSRELDTLLRHINNLSSKDPVDYDKKLSEYQNEIAKAEVDALYEKSAYTWSQTSWVSIWGFYPLTERVNYLSESYTVPFQKKKFKPWEFNFQFNYLLDLQKVTLFGSLGYKVFQNNSALADLMTAADYNQYFDFPNAVDTANAAILQTNKAFIGKFNEFVTNNFNVLVVFSLSDKKNGGGEKLITPGISLRYERNFGDYGAVNWRAGLPLRIRGKDKAINIEPQIKWNNTNNYAGKADYKVQPVFGINVGLPFTPLFK